MIAALHRTVTPVLFLTGLFTAGSGVLVFLPADGVRILFDLPLADGYSILVQHWGLLVGLTGIAIIFAAWNPSMRVPILTFAVAEKAGLTLLYLAHRLAGDGAGFAAAALMDALMAAYYSLCLIFPSQIQPDPEAHREKSAGT